MREGDIRVLALNLGSRYIGIAVFHGPELVEWAMRSIREKSMKEKAQKLMTLFSEIADKHGIDCLTIKGLHPARNSKQLRELTKELKAWAVKKNLTVEEYTIREIEASFFLSERGNKRRLMEEVAARYPFLYPDLEKERQSRNPYLVRMFEAIALGMKCLNELEKPKGRERILEHHEGNKE